MKRRKFVQTASLGVIATGLNININPTKETHTITFSFDDGFRKSFLKAAEIHEEFGSHGCFNVIASGHLPEFQAVDQWIQPELMGDFDDWNDLISRGHEVMPHSWKHLNLARQPLEEAKELIIKCTDYFEQHLDGFKTEDAVFNFPFNSSNDELDAFCLSHMRAVRTRSETPYNVIAKTNEPVRLGCGFHGPDLIDDWMERTINDFLDGDGGWIVLNMHGFDDEGWGPISTTYYRSLLNRLSKLSHVAVKSVGEVLA